MGIVRSIFFSHGDISHKGRSLAGAIFCGLLVVAILCDGAAGQIRLNVRGRGFQRPNTQPAKDTFSAVIQPSEEAANLLRRADEGIQRKDWKWVVDSLQRIVELPGEHVLTSDGRIYESARRHAHRRIATLPPEGLAAYRLVHGGEAAALLAKGVDKHDFSLLWTVVDKYLCTQSGDVAAVTLADWLIDEGRFSEAAALLQQVQAVFPDSEIPAWVIPVRLAVCAAAMGQRERAQAVLHSSTQPAGQNSATAPATAPAAASIDPPHLREITGYVEHAARQGDREGNASWPLALGSSSRDGKLPTVEPAFMDYPPWVEQLLPESKFDFNTIREYARRQKLLPVRQMVTDGKNLIVKGESDLIALDVDSFTQLWSSKKRREESAVNPIEMAQQQMFVGSNEQNPNATNDNQLRNDPQVVRMLHDSVGADVSIAFNLALTVEWPADPPPVLIEIPTRRVPGRDAFSVTHPNRIAAYSLEDGSLAWKSETSSRPPERQDNNPRDTRNLAQQTPNEVEFLAAPVPVEGLLLAPFRLNSDLYAAILDPKTGKLVKQIYLCGTGGGLFDSLYALQPCVADGLVFIPTGRGLLVAVQTSDWSVRWAVRYDTLPDTAALGGWLPTPVIAVSDVVLLAPGDSDFLLCFDRGSGDLRWKVPREDYQYLLGADDTHVWLAGANLQANDIESGRKLWRIPTGDATGRGAQVGQRIFMPTTGGMKAVEALTGKDIPIKQIIESPDLGNIFTWEGSLYSVGVLKVTKYPDMGQGYEQAVARHHASPADPSRAIRLASLELLKNQPTKALAALASVPDLGDTNKRQQAHIIHLRVRSMLDMVSSGEADPQTALKVLSDARQIAQSPEDAIESALALGDHLRRREQFLDASLQYLKLALSEEGDQMVPSDAGTYRRARGVAVQRMAEMGKKLTDAQTKTLNKTIREWIDNAIQQHDQKSLLWVAESAGLGEQVHEAELVLGKWAAADMRSEQAESYYTRVMRSAKTPELVAEATARLAALCLDADELHQPVTSLELQERLRHDLAAVNIPEGAVNASSTTPGAPGQPQDQGKMLPAGRLIERLKSRIDPKILAAHQTVMKPITLGRLGKANTLQFASTRPLGVRGERIEPLCDKMLMLLDSNNETTRVEAHDAKDNQLTWSAELRLLGDLAVEQRGPIPIQPMINSSRSDSLGRARCVAAGQTMIVNSAYGLHAIGLLTGRRLWSRPFDPPDIGVGTPGDPSGSDAWIWVNDGYVVTIDSRKHLDVAHLNQGDRILWRCTNKDEKKRWSAVRSRGPYVVAVDAGLQHFDVFMLADGRYVGGNEFKQDSSPLRQVNISLYDDVICGLASPTEVVARELNAPGVERWRASMPDPIAQIFKPRPDLLAVADRSGSVQVIDPRTGKKLMETKVTQCTNGVNDGALIDGILYVYGYQMRVFDPGEFEKQQWALAAIKMETGQVLWQYGDLDARTFLSDEILRGSANTIPLAVFFPSGSPRAQAIRTDNGNFQSSAVELSLLDKATGKLIGDKMAASLNNDTGQTRILDVSIWPDRVLVIAGSTYMFFPTSKAGDAVGMRLDHPDALASRGAPGLSLEMGTQVLSNLRTMLIDAFTENDAPEEVVEEVQGE